MMVDYQQVQVYDEANDSLEVLGTELDQWELRTMMTGEYDECGAVLTLTVGSGGVDAQDAARRLDIMVANTLAACWTHDGQEQSLDSLAQCYKAAGV